MAPIRVGIIGLRPMPEDGSKRTAVGYWAVTAHLPALKALPEDYEIVAVCNSSVKSAETAIKQYGLKQSTKAYGNQDDLANDPLVDLVVVSVGVGKHFELAKPALEKKKNVFVEWPLAVGLAQSEELSKLATAAGVRTSVGVQARADPLVVKLKHIVESGQIGTVVHSSAWISASLYPSDTWMEKGEYFLDHKSGGNIFFIFFGHFLDSFTHVLGDFAEVQATLKSAVSSVKIFNAEGVLVNPTYSKTGADQILVQGTLESGAVASLSAKQSKTDVDDVSFRWVISGSEGSAEVIVPQANWQAGEPKRTLRLKIGDDAVTDVDFLAGDEFESKVPAVAANLARQYRAFAKGDLGTVATFESALETHRLLDRIIKAAGWESY
ncbi:oxidoreductase [Xylaria bambusicola]|uniref:oxidoreductase n=1 Tax=Xylaria bambusicola TaxID=326684 RepID=UPI00200801E9|nr:oxidoreductase [Xylaria bambusicola]KAI0521323.1 oxidoreductase [Xylaria bambusicola]